MVSIEFIIRYIFSLNCWAVFLLDGVIYISIIIILSENLKSEHRLTFLVCIICNSKYFDLRLRMFTFDMSLKSCTLNGGIRAHRTFVRFFTSVSHIVSSQRIVVSSSIFAFVTFERFVPCMLPHMHFKHSFSSTLVITNGTNIRFQLTMDSLNMFFQTFWICKKFLAYFTLFFGKTIWHSYPVFVHMSDRMIS